MEHSFDVNIAVEYGVPVAILLKHFHFWCERNKDNDRHLHDGLYWTYHSVSSLQETFPYLTNYQIRQALKDMVKEGLIVEGKYPNRTNRSKWYALTENGKSICRNQQIHSLKTTNGFDEIEQSIYRNQQMDLSKSASAYTDINTYINSDNNTTDRDSDIKSASQKKAKPVRHKYGEYKNVLLSDEDIEKLDAFDPDWRTTMERMSEYCESHGKTYKNYCATIKNWIRKDREKKSVNSAGAELYQFYDSTVEWAIEKEGDVAGT